MTTTKYALALGPAPKTVREVIQEARDLIADPERWCTGSLAKGGSEQAAQIAEMFDVLPQYMVPANVDPTSPLAEMWCAHGALQKTCGITDGFWPGLINEHSRAVALLNQRAGAMYPDEQGIIESLTGVGLSAVAWVNDRLGHEAILAVFDKVLADETLDID